MCNNIHSLTIINVYTNGFKRIEKLNFNSSLFIKKNQLNERSKKL